MSLKRLTSPLLSPINHGFYTRLGGASSGIFEGLNCGTGSSDQAEIVQIIGAAHAGWRGALNGVLDATIDAMEGLGAQRENIVGVIGPCISQPAYEVGQDFIERFLEASPDNHCFFSNAKAPEKYLFNLPGYGLFRLRKAGIKAAEWTQYCTYSDPKRFFSYRRATHQKQADYGRLISTIRLS